MAKEAMKERFNLYKKFKDKLTKQDLKDIKESVNWARKNWPTVRKRKELEFVRYLHRLAYMDARIRMLERRMDRIYNSIRK